MRWVTEPEVLDRVLAALWGPDPAPRWEGPTITDDNVEPLPVREPGFTFHRRDGGGSR
jgi:hypothetical protein